MFFLLPMIVGAAATAISAGEVMAGIAGAVGIGTAVKGAMDTRKANDIRKSADEKYDAECTNLKNEVKRTQRKAEEFGRMKKRIYSGVLKDAISTIRTKGELGKELNLNTCVAKILEKDIERFEHRFSSETTPFPSLVKSCGIEPVMSSMMQNIGLFGSGTASLSFAPFIIPSMLMTLINGNQKIAESERFAGKVDVECERIETKIELCRVLRKRILEGMKVTGYLSEKLSDYSYRLSKINSAGNVLSDEEKHTLFDRMTTLAVALKKVMEAVICKTDGTLIESTDKYFKKLMKEDW